MGQCCYYPFRPAKGALALDTDTLWASASEFFCPGTGPFCPGGPLGLVLDNRTLVQRVDTLIQMEWQTPHGTGYRLIDTGPYESTQVNAGQELVASTDGGGVIQPLTAAVVVPSAVTGLSPDWTGTQSGPSNGFVIPRTQDFTFAWVPQATVPGEVGVELWMEAGLFSSEPTFNSGDIVCEADDFAGSMTVPSSALGHFQISETTGNCEIRRIGQTMVDAGDDVLIFQASQSVSCNATFE